MPWQALAFAVATALTAACGEESPMTIERDRFIATYADLRVAALSADSGWLSEAQREEVLQRHGVAPEDLTRFADVHGPDLAYMRQLWNDVEARIDSIRAPEEPGAEEGAAADRGGGPAG